MTHNEQRLLLAERMAKADYEKYKPSRDWEEFKHTNPYAAQCNIEAQLPNADIALQFGAECFEKGYEVGFDDGFAENEPRVDELLIEHGLKEQKHGTSKP